MKKGFAFWQVIGFLFVSAGGTLLHFVYEWCNNSTFAGLFSAVNESTWEHMKLFYFPWLFFAVFEAVLFKGQYDRFWCVKFFGLLAGLLAIPVIYYTYTGVFGVSVDWFNITIFFIATAIAFFVETRLLQSRRKCRISAKFALLIIIILGVAFWVLTFSPPQIPFFQDPVTKTTS